MAAGVLLTLTGVAWAKELKANLGRPVKLQAGDSVRHPRSGYSVRLTGFRVYKSECAVPDFNCGAGYHPDPITMPLFDVARAKSCARAPQPKSCEVTHEVLASDDKAAVTIRMIGVFDPCMKHDDLDNRNSCIAGVVKNGPEDPPFDPENCEKILDQPERRDACYEAIADKLGDPKVCDRMKGPPGFQCILLKARAAKDPAVCRTLQRNRFHHTDADYLGQVDACVDSVKAGAQ